MLTGCVKKEKHPESKDKIKVLCTIAMIGDLVGEIGKEDVNLEVLIKGELDPHTYELVKGDDEKFFNSDLIFYNGLGLEHGLSLRRMLEESPNGVGLGDIILKNEPSLILTLEGQNDPHIWMDISLWSKIVDPIVLALSQKKPEHAELYQSRGESLVNKLIESDQSALEKLHSIPENKRYLITGHNAFYYFTKRYLATEEERSGELWRARTCAPEGLAPDAEICINDLYAIIDYIKKYNVKTLFPETNLNKDALKKIVNCCDEMGLHVKLASGPLYGDAMGEESYLKMMAHNIDVIEKELKSDE
jgi:manganese/zinc/iron transport system substrate-binding protein